MTIFDKIKLQFKKETKKNKEETHVKARVGPLKKEEEKKDHNVLKREFLYEKSVLFEPLVSEKATKLSSFNQYIFSVNPKANKIEIKNAIHARYQVNPISVHVVKMKGKHIRFGRTQGNRRAWKKAIITLKKGESIKLHKGV